MTYSIDFRRHVLAVREKEGLTHAETSQRFKVGIASLVRWNKRLETKTYVRTKCKIDLQKLTKDVEDHPDDYQFERAARFGVRQQSIWRALRKLKITYKKSPETSKSERRQTAYLQG